jgi:hypothetical protein
MTRDQKPTVPSVPVSVPAAALGIANAAPVPPDALTGHALTDIAIRPALTAGVAIEALSNPAGKLEPLQIAHALRAQMDAVAAGNLGRQEDTLVAQSHTLDALFSHLLRVAIASTEMQKMETYMRLALKAQSQSRATIETLSLMKNPPSALFVKQQNVAAGHQQVNNGASPGAGKSEKPPIEQFSQEQRDGTQVDFGAAAPAIGAHSNVAPLGAVKRAANDRRKIACQP